MGKPFPAYVQVYNTAIKQQVSFEEMRFSSLEEARQYRDELRTQYGQIGCHRVRLFTELYPLSEEEEDEFDEDEMEEIAEIGEE